jgi:molybdopterin molybdotransferase
MLTPADAQALIASRLRLLSSEFVDLPACVGAVLRRDVVAERDQPAFDRVTMDGIALDSRAVAAGVRRLRVQATQAAGQPPHTLAHNSACIEIMTGAVLPSGCDAVVPVEQLTLAEGVASLADAVVVQPFQFIHRRGSDKPAGAVLVSAGSQLRAPEIAIAASAGHAQLEVSVQPRIAVISTGDELVEPGAPILPHQIRRSNVYGVMAALQRHDFRRVIQDHIPDDRARLRQRLAQHLAQQDVLILSGGVSMGKFDFVPSVLAELGVQMAFHKVQQRPGKPFWFGSTDRVLVFALPGNPVSTFVCLARYVLPALSQMLGAASAATPTLALAEPVTIQEALTTFVPVRMVLDEDGRAWAKPRLINTSGDDNALVGMDGCVQLPPGPDTYPRGFTSCLYPW